MKAFEHHYWTVECTDCGDPIEGDTEREAVRSARVLGYHEVDGRVVCGDCLETISYGGTND